MKMNNSLGLANLLQEFVSPNDVILDLGSFASGTTQAFLKHKCRCYVEDLPEFINDQISSPRANFAEELAQHLVILSHDVKVDVILTWDLFHYLDLESIEILFSLLKNKLKPGTTIHATRHTTARIPETPQLFKLLDDFSYEMVEILSEQKVPNRSHSTIELLNHLQHFSLYNTLTHKNKTKKGIVEYALRYEAAALHHSRLKPVSITTNAVASVQDLTPLVLPNLSRQLNQFKLNKARVIFDCGVPLIANKTLLLQLSETVISEDLYSSMQWHQKMAVGSRTLVGNQMLTYNYSLKFDLVLLWDLINFWEAEDTLELTQKITQHMEPGALLHIVIPHSGHSGEKPAHYQLESDLQVSSNINALKRGAFKTQTTSQLVRTLRDFKVKSYYFGAQQSGENYQEYLFEYKGSSR